MSSAICFNLDQSKILSSGNGLRRSKMFHLTIVKYVYTEGLDRAQELSHTYEPLAYEVRRFHCTCNTSKVREVWKGVFFRFSVR